MRTLFVIAAGHGLDPGDLRVLQAFREVCMLGASRAGAPSAAR